jgi:hypothetical protein
MLLELSMLHSVEGLLKVGTKQIMKNANVFCLVLSITDEMPRGRVTTNTRAARFERKKIVRCCALFSKAHVAGGDAAAQGRAVFLSVPLPYAA